MYSPWSVDWSIAFSFPSHVFVWNLSKWKGCYSFDNPWETVHLDMFDHCESSTIATLKFRRVWNFAPEGFKLKLRDQ